jgi:choline dehydrogenase-like flavoprotein
MGWDERGLTRADPAWAADAPDFLIVGAGAAGCVLARRLAEQTGAAVVLLEAGGEPDPDAAPDGWRLGKPADWGFESEPDGSDVVDHLGRVHGVEAVHVIDASIIPDPPSGFAHVITIMAAEHLAARLSP